MLRYPGSPITQLCRLRTACCPTLQSITNPTCPPYLPTSQALPRLAQQLSGWSPLDQPGLPVASFAAWRPLLESESAQQGSVLSGTAGADLAADPYMRLVAELVLPPLRKELTNEWDPR